MEEQTSTGKNPANIFGVFILNILLQSIKAFYSKEWKVFILK